MSAEWGMEALTRDDFSGLEIIYNCIIYSANNARTTGNAGRRVFFSDFAFRANAPARRVGAGPGGGEEPPAAIERAERGGAPGGSERRES